MAPVMHFARSLSKRASLKPLTPASLALIIVGCLLVLTVAAVGFIYYRKGRATPTVNEIPKPDDRSSSTASEEHQMQPIHNETPAPLSAPTDAQDFRYSAGIMSRMSQAPRTPRMPRSPANNRYSVGMLTRTSIDPSVSSPKTNRDRSRSRSRADRDRAYARMSMGIMSRASMGGRSPARRSPISPQDPLLSAGIMSRASMGPTSPMPRHVSAVPSPAFRSDNDFLDPPPRYS